MIKILITNDDGIFSDGIKVLADIAKDLGKVYVAAPDRQRSAVSHGITIHEAITAEKIDFPVKVEEAWSISSTPADCVRVALNNLLEDKPDIILSGINNGTNFGGDILYSGTVAGAVEGYQYKIPSIALSLDGDNFDVCRCHIGSFLKRYIDIAMGYKYVLNVNIPSCSAEDFKGIRYARLSREGQYPFYFSEKKVSSRLSSFELHLAGEGPMDENSDVYFVKHGFISVTPIAPNFENLEHAEHLIDTGLFDETAYAGNED